MPSFQKICFISVPFLQKFVYFVSFSNNFIYFFSPNLNIGQTDIKASTIAHILNKLTWNALEILTQKVCNTKFYKIKLPPPDFISISHKQTLILIEVLSYLFKICHYYNKEPLILHQITSLHVLTSLLCNLRINLFFSFIYYYYLINEHTLQWTTHRTWIVNVTILID